MSASSLQKSEGDDSSIHHGDMDSCTECHGLISITDGGSRTEFASRIQMLNLAEDCVNQTDILRGRYRTIEETLVMPESTLPLAVEQIATDTSGEERSQRKVNVVTIDEAPSEKPSAQKEIETLHGEIKNKCKENDILRKATIRFKQVLKSKEDALKDLKRRITYLEKDMQNRITDIRKQNLAHLKKLKADRKYEVEPLKKEIADLQKRLNMERGRKVLPDDRTQLLPDVKRDMIALKRKIEELTIENLKLRNQSEKITVKDDTVSAKTSWKHVNKRLGTKMNQDKKVLYASSAPSGHGRKNILKDRSVINRQLSKSPKGHSDTGSSDVNKLRSKEVLASSSWSDERSPVRCEGSSSSF